MYTSELVRSKLGLFAAETRLVALASNRLADSDRYEKSRSKFHTVRAYPFFLRATSTVNLNKKPTMR